LFLRIFASASRHCHEGLKSGFQFTLRPVNENNNNARVAQASALWTAHARARATSIDEMTRAGVARFRAIFDV
jgi:hypothetical protein